MDAHQKKEMITRLKSVEGHVRGVQRMMDEDAYCIDVIKQVMAVQRALDKVNSLILDNHLNTCVTTAIRGDDPNDRQRVIGELLGIFETSRKI
ncbi:MAG: metal-sensitive transcriptional regulator [Chloroflexi bacterium]|nr:metal-sensitive transcriptional regulator [Chloroflexota bacterium]